MSAAITCQQRLFGTLATGDPVTCYSLRNPSGMVVHVINYGATLNSVQIPDSRGNMHEIGLGLAPLEEYTRRKFYPGMMLGEIQGVNPAYIMALSNTVWEAESFSNADVSGVKLSFKGAINSDNASVPTYSLTVDVNYSLTATNELIVGLSAITDYPFPLDFNHQSHWNLSGLGQSDILGHVFQVWANSYVNINANGLTTAEVLPTKDTLFDFLQPQHIGDYLLPMIEAAKENANGLTTAEVLPTIEAAKEYDICFYLNKDSAQITVPQLAARIKEPMTGRTLEMYTTKSGLRFCPGMPRDQIIEGAPISNVYDRFLLGVQNKRPMEAWASVVDTHYHYHQETRYKLIW